MNTKPVRAILLESKEPSIIGKLKYGSNKLILYPNPIDENNGDGNGTKPYQIILISLDPNEKIEKGDKIIYINKHPQSKGKPRLDICLDFFDNGNIQPEYNGLLCMVEWKKEYCHKVIAQQSNLSPKLINQLFEEYNSTGMKDFEIEMKFTRQLQAHNNILEGEELKLTNGFITPFEKEINIADSATHLLNQSTRNIKDTLDKFDPKLWKDYMAKYNLDEFVIDIFITLIQNNKITPRELENIIKYNKMETKYSKEKFDGFTHRFIVKIKIDNDWRNDTNITLYSNSDSYQKLEDFLNDKKSDKVVSFKIEHRASKEEDEMSSKFIDEILTNGGF